ncbi:MAG: type II toxin-antitoxin system VapC family toxin [Bacillota bacterium]|nr:type II toxin-antitoxin system VapC family toxin [Bacillota bacterium]
MTEKLTVIYWDSTALLSYLIRDSHSEVVLEKASQKGVHLVTALTLAEVFTAINRIRRERFLPEMIIDSIFELLESGPWSRLNIVPPHSALKELAYKWPLKGSSLWHLATAKTLQQEFPELMILTFDRELARASKGERLKLCINGKLD